MTIKEKWQDIKEKHPWVKPVAISLGIGTVCYGCYIFGYSKGKTVTITEPGPSHDKIWKCGIAFGKEMGAKGVLGAIQGHCPEANDQIAKTYQESFNFRSTFNDYLQAYLRYINDPENSDLLKYITINIPD